MNIPLQDSTEIPLPPENVRLREVRVRPYPDGRRVRVFVELDAFQKRPSLEIVILDAREDQLAQTRVIESMARKLELTMHLRDSQPGSAYTLQVKLYYEAAPRAAEAGSLNEIPEPQWIDQRKVSFTLAADGSIPVTGQV